MNRLVKLVVFSAVIAAGSLFSAPKAAEAGYGYGYGYNNYGYHNSYYAPRYVPVIKVVPSYGYGYGYYNNFCY